MLLLHADIRVLSTDFLLFWFFSV